MKRIFTFLLSVFAVTFAMAQAPTGVFAKATVAPVIDGVIDAVWSEATVYNIDKVSETAAAPTLGASGETTWQGLWTTEGVYVLLKVTDDAFYPAYAIPSDASWEYDKPEIYFDCNFDLVDGQGPVTAGNGHQQFAPPFVKDKIDGTPISDNTNNTAVVYADMVDGSNYIAEYFIPFSRLVDRTGAVVDLTNPVGFDVNIIDRDPDDAGRRNAIWASAASGSWDNMDNSGTITFDGAIGLTDIETIAITGGADITSDNGTLQLNATFTPVDATQTYKWVVTNGTGIATVSSTGLVTAKRNGTVSIKALSANEFVASNEITVSISNQIITLDRISLFKNGDFNKGVDNMESWIFTKGTAEAAAVEDGWLKFNMVPQVNIWDIRVDQGFTVSDATTKYIIKFKAKASANMDVPLINEDNQYSNAKNGVSTSPYGLTSSWVIPVTTEPKWYEVDVVYPNRMDNSRYTINWQIGLLDGSFYLDSVYMYAEADLALISTSSKTIASNQLSVYPNPVVNELTVNLTSTNVKIAIYNALGQKMMEKISTGSIAKFNVNSLQKGLYFVKLSDGSTQKFIK